MDNCILPSTYKYLSVTTKIVAAIAIKTFAAATLQQIDSLTDSNNLRRPVVDSLTSFEFSSLGFAVLRNCVGVKHQNLLFVEIMSTYDVASEDFSYLAEERTICF